ncbi:dTDP-4-dehydrorhamnose reductase [Shewanella sp. AS1]|uniref:dTDP-4-dehydrorhamnose reductase n=1 Tax=Shewanella sp. AS1 TaxID=2907626 RepID=UPI001F44FCF3|nr:dTDP-4-dehydrorhamnose reductase [Shewanella sp. AS1]MCE9680074.1 dTDP-4-dehydrorhamnose reductase [Shewanella sp. AS1]
MKVLITGSSGQVGRALVAHLKRQWQGKAQLLALDAKELDITQQAAVMVVVRAFLPDVIINAAAYTAVDKAESDEMTAYSVNCDGAKYLAQAASEVGACILHISTDYVFDGNKAECYHEADFPVPQNVYGRSKLAGELAVINACPRHVILRTSWVFAEQGNNFVNTMLSLAKTRESVSVVSDQFGSPTYAGDIASVLIEIAEQIVEGKQAWGIYHYSGLPHVSWYDFARAIFEQAKEQGLISQPPRLKAISSDDYPTPTKRPANTRLDCQKIEANFGIKPSDWQAALELLIARKISSSAGNL